MSEIQQLRQRERKLLWKLDLLLMPLLTVTLGLQYYDKAALSSAASGGILADLGLSVTHNGVTSTARYSTATACFYYGYIVAVLPIALILARLNLRYAAGGAVTIWGVVCMLSVVCTNYKGFYVQRIFLGLLESVVSPAFVAVTALWYKPHEQAVRLGIWYSATGIFSMISGAINYGLVKSGGAAHGWKNIYYFCGAVTIFWGLVVLALLPASPLEPGPLFNQDEKELLVRRFEENPYGRDRQTWKKDQVVEALVDVKTWIYLLMAAMIYICNGSVTAFGTLIIKSIGYTSLTSIALLIPGGAVTCVTIYIFVWLAGRYKNARTILLPLSCIPVYVGAIVIWAGPWTPHAGPLIGYYLVASFGAPYVLLLALGSANTAGSTKKAVTSGAIFVGYNVGNIAASYTVNTKEASVKYRTTWIVVVVAMSVTVVASFVLRALYIAENRRRDAAQAGQSLGPTADDEKLAHEGHTDVPVIESVEQYVDLTDKQRPEFRYSL
ncbi:hypothetical protein Q5752_001202 [Cryptotrichosporon argae]